MVLIQEDQLQIYCSVHQTGVCCSVYLFTIFLPGGDTLHLTEAVCNARLGCSKTVAECTWSTDNKKAYL